MNSKRYSLLILVLLILSPAAAAAFVDDTVSAPSPAGPEPFTITVFSPSPNQIHSDQVLDQINTLDRKGVLFGTSFGLSQYNGTWSTRHINRDNISEGLMDDFITAVEFDQEGNLWIGYSGGIQIYDGIYYKTLRDQQLFKNLRINDLQRWDDDMWVATGNAGIHRYRDGRWTWFQPMTTNGPEFYEAREMVLDTNSDSLLIATVDNGLWIVRSPDNPVIFEQIEQKYGPYGQMTHVKRDPLGGAYFFNDISVVHYSPVGGFIPLLTIKDLSMKPIEINDLSAAPDGSVYLATDDGIYIWKDSSIYRHITRFEGIGTSEAVRTVTVDSQNRAWFTTSGYVGYYVERSEAQNPIQIEIVTAETASVPVNQTDASRSIPTLAVTSDGNGYSETRTEGLAPILDPILHALNTFLSKLGITVQ